MYGNSNIKNLLDALRKRVKEDIEEMHGEVYVEGIGEVGAVQDNITVDEAINNMTNIELVTMLDEVLQSGDIEIIIGDDD